MSKRDEKNIVRFPHNWDVPIELRRQVAAVPGQQRALAHDGHLLLLLHVVPENGGWRREICLFWRSPDGTWMSNTQSEGMASLERHVENYAAVIQTIENEVELLASAKQCHSVRKRLAPIHRAAHNLYAALLEAHELCLEDEGLAKCRNIAANVRRATDLLTEDVRNCFEFALAREAERQSRTSYRLSLLSATFFPIMTFATIFGMNVESGLESQSPWLFWMMMFAGVASGMLVRWQITDNAMTPLAESLFGRKQA